VSENWKVAAIATRHTNPDREDRVKLKLGDSMFFTVYVHYEKINKICTFCAGFFHHVKDCPKRHSRLMQQPAFRPQEPLPFDVYGCWMTRISDIPMEAVKMHTVQQACPLLRKFQQHFSQKESGASGSRQSILPSAAILLQYPATPHGSRKLTVQQGSFDLTPNPDVQKAEAFKKFLLPLQHGQKEKENQTELHMTQGLQTDILATTCDTTHRRISENPPPTPQLSTPIDHPQLLGDPKGMVHSSQVLVLNQLQGRQRSAAVAVATARDLSRPFSQ